MIKQLFDEIFENYILVVSYEISNSVRNRWKSNISPVSTLVSHYGNILIIRYHTLVIR